jgi:hypothetical protein
MTTLSGARPSLGGPIGLAGGDFPLYLPKNILDDAPPSGGAFRVISFAVSGIWSLFRAYFLSWEGWHVSMPVGYDQDIKVKAIRTRLKSRQKWRGPTSAGLPERVEDLIPALRPRTRTTAHLP